MNVPLADLQAQHRALSDELTAAFAESLVSCDFGGLGASTLAFETETAQLCGARHGLGVGSGTDALLLSLLALGVGPGDEVVTTPFTFVATAETICLAGATPVFADIDPRTFNLDPARVEEKMTPRTKAIIPVHLFGQMADMDALTEAANGVPLVGDGAQAIGATRNGRPMGAWGALNTLSFFPTKNLGACGDGGMILTDSDEFADAVRLLRFHGSGGKGYFYHRVGYCSRLDGLQASLLRVKARCLQEWNEARRRNAARYDALLGSLSGQLETPAVAGGNHHIYHQYTVRVGGGRRDDLQKHLASQGVQSGIYYPLALHLQPAYAHLGDAAGSLPESERATAEVLSLPVHPDLTPAQVDYAAEAVRAFFV